MRRTSIVPTMDNVQIDTHHPAPKGDIPSLDFERIVNAYSIMAVKSRLIRYYNLSNRKKKQQRRISTYDSFQAFRGSQKHLPEEKEDRVLLHTPSGKTVTAWFLTFLTGLLCGAVAIFILWCVKGLSSFRESRINWQLQVAAGTADEDEIFAVYNYAGLHRWSSFVPAQFGYSGIFLELVLANILLAGASAVWCLKFAPDAIGSGLPEVKAYLNGVSVKSFADLNTLLAKIFGTILSVSSGLVVGPEGPLVHIGAILGVGLTKTTHLETSVRRFQKHHPKASSWLGCAPIDVFGEKQAHKKKRKWLEASARLSPENQASAGWSTDSPPHESHKLLPEITEVSSPGISSCSSGEGSSFYDGEDLEAAEEGCAPVENGMFSRIIQLLAKFRNDSDRRDLISIGVAVGFAAAFGAPVGGLLYSVEEASSFFDVPLMWRTLTATAIGTFVISLYYGNLSQFSVLSLGQGVESEMGPGSRRFEEVPLYILVGAGGGLVGAFFNQCYKFTTDCRKRFYGRPSMTKSLTFRCKLLEVVIVSLLTSATMYLLPVMLPEDWVCTEADEKPLVEGVSAGFGNRYNCPVGHFNELGTILLGSRDEALDNILTDPSKFEPRTLLMSGVVFLFFMIITFGVAIPSGAFMPTLLTGSTLGGWAGLLIQRHLLPSIVPAHFSLIGATSMLAGIQRTTVSLCVIMVEATGQVKVLIPLIIAVVVARYLADLFNEGFYHITMESKGYPYLEHKIKETFDICSVNDIMTSPVITLTGVETAGRIERLLQEHDLEGFPVLDQETDQCVGIIRRDQLVALLECGIFLENTQTRRISCRVFSLLDNAQSEDDMDRAFLFDNDTTAWLNNRRSWLTDNVVVDGHKVVLGGDETLPKARIPIPASVVEMQQGKLIVRLSPDVRNNHIDVAAAMNRGVHSVMQNCPVSKAYEMFTHLGLRHLLVLGIEGSVVGMITRSNLLPEYMEERTGLEMDR